MLWGIDIIELIENNELDEIQGAFLILVCLILEI